MNIVMIVNDVDPSQVGELMAIIEETIQSGAGWKRNREYSLGVLDTDCHTVEVQE